MGTGFRGEIDGSMAELVKIINTAGKPVVAVDMPSGVDADTGQVRGIAVQASHTITFGLAQAGIVTAARRQPVRGSDRGRYWHPGRNIAHRHYQTEYDHRRIRTAYLTPATTLGS